MIRRARRERRGTTLVEMAFVSLICLVFMFAIFEYGRYVYVRQVMEHAARTGAREAVVTATSYVDPTVADNSLKAKVDDALASLPITNKNVQAYQANDTGTSTGAWTSTPFGKNIVVQIDADVPLMFPTFGFLPNNGTATNSVKVTVKCMMRGEAN